MKAAALAFFLVLVLAHRLGDPEQLLGQPLSMFRDGDGAWLGYGLFALLLLVGALYTAALARCRREPEAAVSGLAVGLLLVVAATPSFGPFHLLCSVMLLGLLFAYYATLLHHAGSPWLILHLPVPVLLVLVTRFHSYGAWQKSLIAYFVLAAVVHHHTLVPEPPRRPRRSWEMSPPKRRKVYRVEPGRAWARQRKSPELFS